MKLSKGFNLAAGILDILFAMGMVGLLICSFVYPTLIQGTSIALTVLIYYVIPTAGIVTIATYATYALLGILGLTGVLSLVFGSVTVARVRKGPKSFYYKGGRLIAYAIVETIILAGFAFLLYRIPNLTHIVAVSLLGTVVVLRYLGIGFFYCSKKKFVEETPVSK